MKKKISLMIVAIMLLQIVLPIISVVWESDLTIKSIAATAGEATVGGITWIYELQDKQAINVKPKDNSVLPMSVIIPNTLNGYTVTSIGEYAFNKCSNLTNVTIPGSVKSIGYCAFNECTSLTGVEIESGVEEIGKGAFQYCSNLTNVTIPGSVKSIGDYAFNECTSLTGVEIESGVEDIGKAAFYKCSKLTNVTIPGSVKSIGYAAFGECTSLTGVEIESGVEDIGEFAFNNCSNLTNVTIPGSVKSIGKCAFQYCTNLTKIEIASTVTNIDSKAFIKCSNLTIYCKKGSYAEEYAKTNNIKYINKDVDSYLNNIKITKLPAKIEYVEKENFDKIGMEVTAIYNNGSKKLVTNYTIKDGENLKLDQTNVTISYTENGITKETKQEITVVEKGISSIEITNSPTKISYIEGENFDKTGMKVVAKYNDGTSKEITNYTVTNGENLKLDQTSVTISYTEEGIKKEAIQAITVVAKDLEIKLVKESEYEIKEESETLYIEKIKPNTTIKDVISDIKTNGDVKIYKGTTEITDKNTKIVTGMTIKISKGTKIVELKIVVTGDLNGDGQMNDIDLLMLARYKVKLYKGLKEEYLRASDIIRNGIYADDMDLLKMSRVLVGLDKI